MTKSKMLFVLTALLMLSACQSPQETLSNKEAELIAAGFIKTVANTPQREAMLQTLPQHKIFRRVNGDVVTYAFADVLLCNCLYVGTQAAYNEYRFNAQMQRMTDAQEMAVENYDNAAWQWGMWEPPSESTTIIYDPDTAEPLEP